MESVTMLRSPVGRCPHAQPEGDNNTSRRDKGSRSSRVKVVEGQGRRGSRFVEVQGLSRFKVCRGSRFVKVQGLSRLRAWSIRPRCRPTERVRSSRCIHETQSESAEELRRAPPSFLIAFLCFSTLERSSNFHHPRRSSPARIAEVRHVIGCSRDLCRRDGRGRRDRELGELR